MLRKEIAFNTALRVITSFQNSSLRKRIAQGTGRVDGLYLPPHERVNLIRAIHIEVGHYGIHKTYSLLEPAYF